MTQLRSIRATSLKRARGELAPVGVLACVLTCVLPLAADAAGLYFADRGVRPLARGGAFVAGADDLGAVAYNPAGIFDAGQSLLIDGSWLRFTSEFQRKSLIRQIDPNTGEVVSEWTQTFPQVEGESPIMPIPTLVYSHKLGTQWVGAIGAWAPYAAITTYPQEAMGQPAAQRYSLITLEGSALMVVGAWGAHAPSKSWRIGLGVEALVGSFKTNVFLSGCVPERFLCAPEQPEWDVYSELDAGPIFAPSGNVGAIYIPVDWVRIGASVQLPFWVRTGATVKTRLPSTPVFSEAQQEGDEATIAFDLPWHARLGVEFRPIDTLRVEVGGEFTQWSMHDEISIEGDGLALTNIPGFPQRYQIPTLTIDRHFQDTASVRLGGEWTVETLGLPLDLRAGASYETSAVPAQYLSVMTLDAPKMTIGAGFGVHLGAWRLDGVYAHVFANDVEVDPREASMYQLSPVQANPPKMATAINGGAYAMRADIFGLGLTYTFEAQSTEQVPDDFTISGPIVP